MVKRTGPINPYTRRLIESLNKAARELKAPVWKAAAKKLEKPRRQKIEVNLSDIEKNAKEGETILVPGTVLGNGVVAKHVKIAAFRFTNQALKKLKESKCETMSIENLLEQNPEGKNVKILV